MFNGCWVECLSFSRSHSLTHSYWLKHTWTHTCVEKEFRQNAFYLISDMLWGVLTTEKSVCSLRIMNNESYISFLPVPLCIRSEEAACNKSKVILVIYTLISLSFSLQLCYNLGGLLKPFTINLYQRNLVNRQPHSENITRIERETGVQVRAVSNNTV